MKNDLSYKQQQKLLNLARETISCKVNNREDLPAEDQDPVFFKKMATFVTLKISGKLRGCIGNLQPVSTLWDGVKSNAINAAFNDHRFPPLTAEELAAVEIDISVLSLPEPLEYSNCLDLEDKLRPGVDGVILQDGVNGATFLPQVWEQLPSVDLFLGHLCRKAGLAETAWRERPLYIQTYQVLCFHEDKR